jgi:hypothetical protein
VLEPLKAICGFDMHVTKPRTQRLPHGGDLLAMEHYDAKALCELQG